ncbi:MAG: hypothetical protein WBW44_04460 [Solirubrobacterales bacterium]
MSFEKFLICLALFLLALAPGATASEFELDIGFGDGGTAVLGSGDWATDIATARDDSQLVAVQSFGGGGDGVVYRVRLDGTLDPEFGSFGVAEPRNFNSESLFALDVDRDNKILLAGGGNIGRNFFSPILVRLNSDGSIDRSFKRRSLPRRGGPMYRDVIALGNGKVLVAGNVDDRRNDRRPGAFVRRMTSSGEPDPTFGSKGRVVVRGKRDLSTGIQSLQLLPDGKFMAAGYLSGEPFAMRLLRNGRLDKGFGMRGYVRTRIGTDHSCEIYPRCAMSGLVVSPNGSVFVMASRAAKGNGFDRTVVVKLSKRGKLVKKFGKRGRAVIKPKGVRLYPGEGLVRLPDGRLLINSGSPKGFTLVALDPRSGKIDGTFGTYGVLSSRDGKEASAASVVSDGTLYVAGPSGIRTVSVQRFVESQP